MPVRPAPPSSRPSIPAASECGRLGTFRPSLRETERVIVIASTARVELKRGWHYNRLSRRAAMALAALLVAACAGPPPGGGGKASKPTLTVSEPAKGSGAAAPASDSAAVAPDAPSAEIDADPKRLIGLDDAALIAMLGDPEFRRNDTPAEFWRYRGATCTLSLFLYGPEKAAAEDKRVLVRHVEARATGDDKVTTADCLRILLEARREAKTG